MNVNFWKVDVHINWTIVYIEMVLEGGKLRKLNKVLRISDFIRRITTTDAGHGNEIKYLDSGAIDDTGKEQEKDYALIIEAATNSWLTKFGIENHRTRAGDVKHADPFAFRYELANKIKSTVFVSFHLNSTLLQRQNKKRLLVTNFVVNKQT